MVNTHWRASPQRETDATRRVSGTPRYTLTFIQWGIAFDVEHQYTVNRTAQYLQFDMSANALEIRTVQSPECII
jgi:hypothetical protein